MNKKNIGLLLVIIITAVIVMSIGCSPAPMIQSAHVNSAVKTGFNVTGGQNIEDVSPYYTAFGIKDRVELTASFYPRIIGASANIKIFIAERGNKGLFRNMAVAVFSGGKLSSGILDKCKSANAGIIVSTIDHGYNGDMELVFQPSFFRLIDREHDLEDHFRVDGLHLNCGTIFTIDPNRQNRFSSDIRLGVGYQLALQIKNYVPETSIVKSTYNGCFFQFGFDFNWKSDRQMRKKS
ncbi:MAG: hypothetical protein GX639_01665 [Fibrobacter sp.]|nr:hypothetical protein [Fibrobacter sp.]